MLNVSYQTMAGLLENEEAVSTDKYLSAVNAIVERHNSFLRGEEGFEREEKVRYLY